VKYLELVVFDIAGTTVEDRGQVPAAFKAAFEEQGIAVTPEQLSGVRGSSKRQAVRELVPPGPDRERVAETVYDSFCERLTRRYREEGVRPLPGVIDVFGWLKKNGVRLALNTGFDRRITDLLISTLGWANEVNAIVCGDDVREGRPAPYLIFHAMESAGVSSVHRVVTVGDTAVDLRAGYNAGVRCNLGVLSGAHTREQLEREPHTQLLATMAELPDVVSSMFQDELLENGRKAGNVAP
jgi:phosphonatase-like hydrolase